MAGFQRRGRSTLGPNPSRHRRQPRGDRANRPGGTCRLAKASCTLYERGVEPAKIPEAPELLEMAVHVFVDRPAGFP